MHDAVAAGEFPPNRRSDDHVSVEFSAPAFCLLRVSAGKRDVYLQRKNLQKEKYPRIGKWQDDVRWRG